MGKDNKNIPTEFKNSGSELLPLTSVSASSNENLDLDKLVEKALAEREALRKARTEEAIRRILEPSKIDNPYNINRDNPLHKQLYQHFPVPGSKEFIWIRTDGSEATKPEIDAFLNGLRG